MNIPTCPRCEKPYQRWGSRMHCPTCDTDYWPANGVLEIDCDEPPPPKAA